MALSPRAAAGLCRSRLRLPLKRSFSNTSIWRKNGPLATFPKTSSQELDSILNTFRETVFFPNHISKFDHDMIFQPSKHFYLTGQEPVKVNINISPATPAQKQRKPQDKDQDPPAGREKKEFKKPPRATAPAIYPTKKPNPPRETFILNPLNVLSDLPKLHSNYRRMLKLMSAPSDFAVIPGFLRELNLSSMKVTPEMLAGTVRRAVELDRLDVVMHIFQSSESIGLRVNHPKIVTQLMQAIVRHAANGYWAQERLDKALVYSDSVLLMLQDPQHRLQPESEPVADAFQLPQVWGAAMALSAIRQLRYGPRERAPHRYELQDLAQGFMERLDLGRLGEETSSWPLQNMWLADWAPAIFGARYAIQALGASDPSAMKLQLAVPALDEAATKAALKVTEAFPDSGQQKLGLHLAQIMETALTLEAPPAPLVEENVVIQSDGEAISASEVREGESETPAAEADIDSTDVQSEKKDGA